MLNLSPAAYELIGYAAAVLTTFSFAPQAWHTYRSKDVSGISLGMYSVLTIGIVCWLVYGFNLGTLPLIFANAVTLVLALAILVMKLVYSRPAQPPQAKS